MIASGEGQGTDIKSDRARKEDKELLYTHTGVITDNPYGTRILFLYSTHLTLPLGDDT